MILEIVKVPNEILRQRSAEIIAISDELKKLMEDMKETMYSVKGMGLAAVQVGVLQRLIVCDAEYKEDRKGGELVAKNPQVFINPVIIWKSPETDVMDEGCLSIPGERENIKRHLEVKIEYQDVGMVKQNLLATGRLAHCLQHEIDHINGVVYLDYLSKLKRDRIVERVKKRS